MLQIDHIYEFLYQEIFKDFEVWHPAEGVINTGSVDYSDITIFTPHRDPMKKILFYDQEPLIPSLATPYLDLFSKPSGTKILATSEYSADFDRISAERGLHKLYYFFHGFAALDWYRGYYALNHNKSVIRDYAHDFISYNRIINNDRSYRIYFISKLKELGLLDHGQVSFNVTDNLFDDWRDEVSDPNSKLSEQAKIHIEQHLTDIDKLVIDSSSIHGSSSSDIPRNINSWWAPGNAPPDVDAFWHVVTETVFYYDKLHLTEKIFKPIVSKQPFMLLAAPGNLAYLKKYGFKTFDGIINENYDTTPDPYTRIEEVVRQLNWYSNLSPGEKSDIIRAVEPIIEYNFHHFYGGFRHIIVQELLDNIAELFQTLGYTDPSIDFPTLYKLLSGNIIPVE